MIRRSDDALMYECTTVDGRKAIGSVTAPNILALILNLKRPLCVVNLMGRSNTLAKSLRWGLKPKRLHRISIINYAQF
ncbi:MAG: hypothetical protein MJK13_18865 [Pseudomonadales bacterium]|nr:hypothetical protein [Pseudomonadales bacterium]